MRRGLLPLFLILACRAAPAESPRSMVDAFYAATITTGGYGVPTPTELATLEPSLSDTLRLLLAAAWAQHASDSARAPDEKPAFADGNLFSSLFEGPSTATAVADTLVAGRHAVTVRMTYHGATPPVRWTDVALVIEEHGRLVIDDIEYHGTWDFANRGTLRAALAAVPGH